MLIGLLKGRRIIYDYDRFGDSPSCLGKKDANLEGIVAVSQGYGLTETGEENCLNRLFCLNKRTFKQTNKQTKNNTFFLN
jgi:hypothetical protein